jgi:hypothetical protein
MMEADGPALPRFVLGTLRTLGIIATFVFVGLCAAMLVGCDLRDNEHLYAVTHGYFWLPCPICNKPFGGHEWKESNGSRFGAVKEPGDHPGVCTGICPECTRALERIAPPIADDGDLLSCLPLREARTLLGFEARL